MNTTAILRSLRTGTCRYEEHADGVIVQRVLTTRSQTLADARENTAAFAALAGGRPRPALIDMRIVRTMETGARDHYADPEVAGLCSAIAILVASPGSRQLGQHYTSLPTYAAPVRAFVDPAEAVAWLHRVTAEAVAVADLAVG